MYNAESIFTRLKTERHVDFRQNAALCGAQRLVSMAG